MAYLDFFEGTFQAALLKVKALAENLYIHFQANVNASVAKVWDKWNNTADIIKWNAASDDWHTPEAENDLRVGGKFKYVMAAKDGSMKFDFGGIYNNVVLNKIIEYTLADGRNVKIAFEADGDKTIISESFEPERMNTLELQRDGWQAILDNFKKYVEHE